MSSNCRDWRHLPVELLLRVFQFATCESSIDHRGKACTFILVCKAWEIPFQTVLYSEVTIASLSQLKAFADTVQRRPNLGEKVKEFNLGITRSTSISTAIDDEICNLFSDLLYKNLPYLERIRSNGLFQYIPILNALKDSRLEYLKEIEVPDYSTTGFDLANYATCALLMRNRLTKLNISDQDRIDGGAISKRLYFDRLYNNLHQFDKLTDLTIVMSTSNEIKVLEHITNNCKSLEKLTFHFDRIKSGPLFRPLVRPRTRTGPPLLPKASIPKDESSACIPSYNVKTLEATLSASNDADIVMYLMRKFPKVESLTFAAKERTSCLSSQHMLVQLLEFASRTNRFLIRDIRVEDKTIAETIGDYWNLHGKPGNESMNFCYDEEIVGDGTSKLTLSKKMSSNASNATVSLLCGYKDRVQYVDGAWKREAFIERNEKFIKYLTLGPQVPPGHFHRHSEVPNSYLTNIILHCPNLEMLTFKKCMLSSFDFGRTDYSKHYPFLDTLYLNDCSFLNGWSYHLSFLFPRIQTLCLDRNQPIEPPPILMPQSEIECFKLVGWYEGKEDFYVKIFTTGNKLTTLTIDRETDDGVQVLEHITAHCKSLRKLDFTFSSTQAGTDLPTCESNMLHGETINFIPSYNIKVLHASVVIASNTRLFTYLMQKFPGLESLELYRKDRREESSSISRPTLAQLLKFISRIRHVYIHGLYLDDRFLSETISDYWDSNSNVVGGERLQLSYNHIDSRAPEDESLVTLSRDSNLEDPRTRIAITYSLADCTTDRTIFIERNGRHIKELILLPESPSRFFGTQCILPWDFVTSTFAHCPNLKNLIFEYCSLRVFDYREIDLSIKSSVIENLYFNECSISEGVLQQLSILLPRVNRLSIGKLRKQSDSPELVDDIVNYSHEYEAPQIIMPNTHIECIEFFGYKEDDTIYVKIYSISDDHTHFLQCYKTEDGTMISKATTEDEYMDAFEEQRCYVCAQTVAECTISVARNWT